MELNFIDYIKTLTDVYTHTGKFHADDVFATALLKMINPDINVHRVRDLGESFEGLAYDIGRGEFDHHQSDKRVREDGVAYAAFGLIWEKVGMYFLKDEEATLKFDRDFIEPLDQNDNEGTEHKIAKIISNFNPAWDSDEDMDEAFMKAVDWATPILQAEFNQILSRLRAKDYVVAALEKAENKILVLDRSMPWKRYVLDTDMLFVVFPSNRGGYCAQAVPVAPGVQDLRCGFLEEWCGKEREELQQISGLHTLNFCHTSGFLLSAGTLEDAIQACKHSMSQLVPLEGKLPPFLNVSMIASNDWEEEKVQAATQFGPVEDVMVPELSPMADKEAVKEIATKMVKDILKKHPIAVLCEGELGLLYHVIRKLKRFRIPVYQCCYDKENGSFLRFQEY